MQTPTAPQFNMLEVELRKRDRLLQGVAESTNRLLTSTNPVAAMNEALAILGEATNVDRIYIFENHPHPETGESAVSQRFEWARDTVEPQINNPYLQNMTWEAAGLIHWYSEMLAGKSVGGVTRELPESFRAILEAQAILSMLVVPIRIGEKLWGFIGFDDCRFERRWSKSEESVLMVVAASIGGAIERKRAEEALAAEEEELNKVRKLESVGILAGGIAHDFNNILTGIMGNISLTKMILKPDKEAHEILTEAERACLQAKDLTQQLLTFSKGGAPIKMTASIMEILKESASFILRGSKARCEFFISDDLWTVEVDEAQMSQVVQNLMINADQAMPEGGIITVRAENMSAEVRGALPLPAGRYVKISIQDRGIGIPREHLDKIFDPYFTTKQKGSGLGLAISYSIIKKHNGHLSVESNLGVGTTFFIFLPASQKEIQAIWHEEEKLLFGKGSILLMDDEEVVREVASRSLKHLGYDITLTQNGAETIAMYQQVMQSGRAFDAVIMDLTIPGGMGGKEAIDKLLAIDPKVKVIVSSGYSNDPIMADFRHYGFSGVVAKPYRIAELGKVLYDVIKQ